MLSESNAAFIQRHTSMSVGARDARNRPVVGRALGCRVSADRRLITIYLSASRAAALLDCLRQTKVIALAVTRPSTVESQQFKGDVIAIRPLTAEDRTAIAEYRDSFVAELGVIGYRAELARGIIAGDDDAVAVEFEPTAMFDQTPGPRAGTRMGAPA